MRNLILILVTFLISLQSSTATIFTALPPGYEDEILCHPSTACLRPFPKPRGWCGPRTAFVECCDAETGEVSRPRGWGVKLDVGYKDELLLQGWDVARKCEVEEARRCSGKGNVGDKNITTLTGMENVVDRLLGLEVFGFW